MEDPEKEEFGLHIKILGIDLLDFLVTAKSTMGKKWMFLGLLAFSIVCLMLVVTLPELSPYLGTIQ